MAGDLVKDAVNQSSAAGNQYLEEGTAEAMFDFSRDTITTFAVIYTLLTIFFFAMVVLTGMYWNSVPDTQNTTRVNAY